MLEVVCLIDSYLQCSRCNSFRQCIAQFHFIVMSAVPTTKWEANLHGANFWIHGCGGHSKVPQNTGLRIWMLELLYDKYCAPFDIPRVTSFYTCLGRSRFQCSDEDGDGDGDGDGDAEHE